MNTATSSYDDFIKSTNRVHTYMNYKGKYVEFNANISIANGAGTVASSIKEMANWLNFQIGNGKFQGKQIVSTKSLLETRKPQIAMKDSKGKVIGYYGLGWNILINGINKGTFMHTGDAVPSRTLVAFNPSQKWGIVVVSNEGNYGAGFNTALGSAFIQLYNTGKISIDSWPSAKKTADETVEKIFEQKKQKPSPPITPALNLNNYTGIYTSNCYGKIMITSSGNRLKIYQGNNKNPLNLVHWNGNIFRVNYPITDPGINSNVEFKSIKNGKAQLVIITFYEKPGRSGTFKRTT
jgi:hypothetical protein